MNRIIQILRNFTNYHRPGKLPDVFIFSMPRSGSTWLQELLWTQPGFKYCNEPLNIKGPYLQGKVDIHSFEELYSLEVEEKLLKYFVGFHEGKYHFLDPNPLRKYYRPFTNRIVYKIIHGGEQHINAIAHRCNGKVIYLIRHPFAVSLSRRVLPRLAVLCSPKVMSGFSESQHFLAQKIQAEGSHLEKGVLSWCIQNRLALANRRPNWIVFTYEQLVVDPDPIVDLLVRELSLPLPVRIRQQLNVPSAVQTQSDRKTVDLMQESQDTRYGLIERWRSQIDSVETESLWDIIEVFELNIYERGEIYPTKEFQIGLTS